MPKGSLSDDLRQFFPLRMKQFHNSKLFQTLRSLTEAELDQFEQYVTLPFFNTRTPSVLLVTFLKQFAPSYNQPILTGKAVFEALVKGKPYEHQVLKTEFSHLFRLLRGFLAQMELKQRDEEHALLALAQLRKRKVDKVFLMEKNALQKRLLQPLSAEESKLPQAKLQTENRLKFRFLLQEEIERFYGQQQRRLGDTGIEYKMESLDAFYFYHKLRGGCELLNRQNILAKESELPLLEEVQQLSGQMEDEAAIYLYRLVYLCLAEPDDRAHYHQFIKKLKLLQDYLPQEEGRAMYKYAQNYCIARINQGESIFYEQVFQLYQAQLESEIILDSDVLSHSDYSNIATTALRLKKFEWANTFIEQYKSYLLPRYQNNIYQYNLANLYFEQQQFSSAIRLLQQIEMDDPFYETSSKVLLCKVYFESQEWESLRYLLEAFKRYIQRNKALSLHHRTHYLHFLRHLKAMTLLCERRPFLMPADFGERLQKLALRLAADEVVSNKKWLEGICERAAG